MAFLSPSNHFHASVHRSPDICIPSQFPLLLPFRGKLSSSAAHLIAHAIASTPKPSLSILATFYSQVFESSLSILFSILPSYSGERVDLWGWLKLPWKPSLSGPGLGSTISISSSFTPSNFYVYRPCRACNSQLQSQEDVVRLVCFCCSWQSFRMLMLNRRVFWILWNVQFRSVFIPPTTPDSKFISGGKVGILA